MLGYARRLGFGEPTGINDANEAMGKLPSSGLGVDAGRLGAYGEGIEVTPIQLAAITSAIANGGTLLVPRTPRTEQEGAQFEAQIRRHSVSRARSSLIRIKRIRKDLKGGQLLKAPLRIYSEQPAYFMCVYSSRTDICITV
nr:Penicillin binding protein transpeptidase domain protein [uncultured bacterium]